MDVFPRLRLGVHIHYLKEVNPMKNIFGIPISTDEEICEETLHEFGCGCPECTGHDFEEDGDEES